MYIHVHAYREYNYTAAISSTHRKYMIRDSVNIGLITSFDNRKFIRISKQCTDSNLLVHFFELHLLSAMPHGEVNEPCPNLVCTTCEEVEREGEGGGGKEAEGRRREGEG